MSHNKVDDDVSEDVENENTDDDDMLVLETLINHCPPVTVRNLFWNWTIAGDLAIQPCPGGSHGFAKWRCGSDAQWFTVSPDLGECQSLWLTRLEQTLKRDSEVVSVADQLQQSVETKTLYGGDLVMVTQILQTLTHKARQIMFSMAKQEDKELLASRLVEDTLKIGSSLLEDDHMMAWSDLEPVERAQIGSNLVLAIQENSFFLADSINVEKNIIMMEENLLTSVRIMRAKELYDQDFISRHGNVNMIIPAESLIENSENGAVRLVFFHYNNLDHVLPSSTNGVKFLNSHIVSASLTRGHSTLLSQPLRATFQHLDTESMVNPSCVWWDYVTRTWSEEGCWVESSNKSSTSCQCNHLGNFAVLMEEASMYAAPHSIETSSTNTVVIAVVVSIVVVAVAITAILIFTRLVSKTGCKNKMIPCLESKESSPGYYPYLSSSNTSTTITATTPDKNTGSQYFLNNECQVLRPLMITPLGPNSTIYRATFANGQQAHVIPIDQSSGAEANKYQFRPITPSASHIYMEIDPVYQQASETLSDIIVSDTSDDDLKRSADDTNQRANNINNINARLLQQHNQQQQQQQHSHHTLSSILNKNHLPHSDSADFNSRHFTPATLSSRPGQQWSWSHGQHQYQPHSLSGVHHSNNIHSVFQ